MTEGTFVNIIRVAHHAVYKFPDSMSYTLAASVAVVSCTAQYLLIDVGRLRKGETVLIHAAAGGVGQAAIVIAQNIGAEIFSTVGSIEEKTVIQETYGIAEDHICSSRDDVRTGHFTSNAEQRR